MMKCCKILFFIVGLLFVSCADDVDFDQVSDIEINNAHQVSLIYFTATAPSFLDELNNEALFFSDTLALPIFSGSYSQNYLIQADFHYKISNTFDRIIAIQYEFLDVNENVLYLFNPLVIPPNTVGYEETQTIDEANIPNILQTENVIISLLMSPSVIPLDPNQNSEINFQSGATFHYRVTVDE